MSTSLQALGIDRLTVSERLQLFEDLWDDLAETIGADDIPQSHKDELDRRIAAAEFNPEAGFSWEDVKSRLGRKSDASS